MPKKDPRVDAFIAKSEEFAKPILKHLRSVVHEGCPPVEETIKWGFPFFTYKNQMFAHMASFKRHCAFGFWKGALVVGEREKDSMGHLGKITKLSDLPPKKVLLGYIKKAKQLNDDGIPHPTRSKRKPPKPVLVPAYLKAALARNKKASTTFEGFPPSHRRDYVEWLTEAKTDDTRSRRLATTIEWLAEGKPRNWKYMKRR